MGHYASEMDPEYAARQRIAERMNRIRGELKDVPLGEFTVGELEAVMRLMGLAYNGAGTLEPHKEHFKQLEAVVARIKQKQLEGC
ncbi:MAG: hypothetical protein WD898_03390 [Candidatus Paceibacterota bacterium]